MPTRDSRRRATSAQAAASALVPAAARTPDVLTAEEVDLNAGAIETFTKAVGGRDQLVDVLSVAASAPEIARITTYMIDPRYQRWSVRRLCTLAGITVADLFSAYKKALIARAHIEATRIIAEKLPPIVEDVMARAVPQKIVCSKCAGVGCPECAGRGFSFTEPELERQKLALDLGHLTPKKAGLTIQQNQIAASAGAIAAAGGGVLEQLQQTIGEMLFNPARRRAMSPPLRVESEGGQAPVEEPTRIEDLPLSEPEPDENDEDDDGEPEPPLQTGGV